MSIYKKNASYSNILRLLLTAIISIIIVFKLQFNSMQIIAFLVLLVNVGIIYKSRRNSYSLLVGFLMLYFNYGIVVGEYLAKNKQPELNSIRMINNGYYYNLGIVMLLLFLVIYLVFIKVNDKSKYNAMYFKNNSIIFYSILIALVLICIFCVNRVRGYSYSVNISPIYEYSYILFIFLIRYSNNDGRKKIIIFLIASIFIIQDFYYGGRITSIQISLVIITGFYLNKINIKNLTIGVFIGIIIMSFVSSYRGSYSLDRASIMSVWENLKKDLFVDYTAIYAYNSSITHIAGGDFFNFGYKMKSFFGFIVSIFIGENSEIAKMGNVTRLVDPIYNNIGGGLIFSHFYFWLGWIGIVIGGIVISVILNKLIKGKHQISNLMLIGFIATMPRWYLYSPLAIFRSVFVFIPIAYVICIIIEGFFKGVRKNENITN